MIPWPVTPFEEKVKFFILYFEDLMETSKENREEILKNDPEKAKLVLAKPAYAKTVP